MKQLVISFLLIISSLHINTAHAVAGVGDITFDPTTYGAVYDSYEVAKKAYQNAQSMLKKVSDTNKTINDAYKSYDKIKNFDFKRSVNALKFNRTKNANGVDKIDALRSDLSRSWSTTHSDGNFLKYNTQRINDLEELITIQDVSAKNANDANKDIGQKESARITAQSAASIAALQAAREQRDQQEAIRRDMRADYDRKILYDTKNIYRAIGESAQ